jgi:cytoskeletal protein CcmA (bactofilin family)
MSTAGKTTTPNPEAEGQARIAEASRFEGRWSGDNLSVQGLFDGELSLSGWLRIGRIGRVQGRVKANSVQIAGEFDGEVRTQDLVFDQSARAKGTFISERLVMRDGATVDGSFAPRESSPAAPASPHEAQEASAPKKPEAKVDATAQVQEGDEANSKVKSGEGGSPAAASTGEAKEEDEDD